MMNFLNKLDDILYTIHGWIVGCVILVADFFAGHGLAFLGVLICIVLDAIFGIWAALKEGKFVRSELLRDSISKIAAYGCALIVMVFVERIIGIEDNPLLVSAVAACICLVEGWSLTANALIVNPNLHFFKLLQPALKGEIARKLKIKEEDVDVVLDMKATAKKNKKNAKNN